MQAAQHGTVHESKEGSQQLLQTRSLNPASHVMKHEDDLETEKTSIV
jgi:hypothetical protein